MEDSQGGKNVGVLSENLLHSLNAKHFTIIDVYIKCLVSPFEK